MRALAVKSFAPATIANLGSGFDVIGIAMDQPGDTVIARRRQRPGLGFTVRTKQNGVPVDPAQNVASFVASLMLEEFSLPFGITMTLHKGMPIASGLGSSAASSVASVVAVNALLPRPLPRKDLLRFAMEGERKASGAAHADNVAPSLLGGACLIRSYDPLDVVKVPTVATLLWIVVHPHIALLTRDARDVLPDHLPLKAAIHQWGNVGGLITGLITGDAPLIGRCTEDIVAEPARAHFIPAFNEVREAALHAGASGCSLCGSGPSLFAVTGSPRSAGKIGAAMKNAFARVADIPCDVYISRVNQRGATVKRWK
jgi:homoserine kinase